MPAPVKPNMHYLKALHMLRRPPHLISVTTAPHGRTLHTVELSLAARGIRHERWSYAELFSRWQLPRAVYILTDFDRLHPWQIEVAAKLRRRLLDRGLTVLNDPGRFVPRAALLKRLHREGINSFTCWLPVEGEIPKRYPAFLRTVHAHRGVESGLLHNETQALEALETALKNGRVLCDLVFVEYAAEAEPNSGKFRKHACYGVNGTMIRALTVTDDSWVAKNGTIGAATEQDYARDLTEQLSYPHTTLMKRVFELAGLEFGRIDYGIVGGRPEIYELNSNPNVHWGTSHPSQVRMEADRIISEQFLDALCALPFPKPWRNVGVFNTMPRLVSRRRDYGQP